MVSQYEPQSVYEERQKYLQQKQQGGFLSRALDLLGRPQAAVQTGLAELVNPQSTPASNPLAAFMAGLTGQEGSIRTGEQFLQQGLGMGEGPGIQTPLGRLTARGVAGFATGAALDPTTYLPVGRIARMGAEAAGFTRAARAAAPAAGLMPEGVTVSSALREAQSQAPTLAQQATRQAAKAPVVGPIVRAVANVISPRILEDTPLGQLTQSVDKTLANQNQVTAGLLARLDALPHTIKVVDNRVDLGAGGKVAYGDLVQDPDAYRAFLSPQDYQYLRQAGDVVEAVSKYRSEHLNQLMRVAPEAAKTMQIEPLGFTGTARYFPRHALRQEGGGEATIRAGRVVSPRRSFEQERKWPTMEAGLQGGEQYLGDIGADVSRFVNDTLEQVAQMDFAREAVQSGIVLKQKNMGLLEQLRGGAAQARDVRQLSRQVAQVAARAGRGEVLPYNTIERIRRLDPDIADLIDQAQAVSFPDLARIVRQSDNQLWDAIKIPKEDFIKAVEDWRVNQAATTPLGRRPTFSPYQQNKITFPEMRAVYNDLVKGANVTSQDAIDALTALHRNAFAAAKGARQQQQDLLNQALTQARGLVDQATQFSKGAQQTYRGAAQAEAAGVSGLETIGTRFLTNLWFDPETKQRIVNYFGRKTSLAGLEPFTQASSIARTASATMDVAGMMIQGLPFLATNPVKWGQVFMTSLKSLWDPANEARILAQPESQAVYRALPGLKVTYGGGSEFFQAVPGAGMDQVLNRGQQAFRAAASPFQRVFETQGDLIRLEWAKALLPTAQRTGKTQGLADFLNHATGIANMQEMGIGPLQRQVESSFLFFAPSYTRSALALVGDLMSNGVARDEAAKALGSMLVTGIGMYRHVAEAAGQDPVLDPSDTRFLTVDVAGTRVGVGSVWVSLARLLGNIATSNEPGQAKVWDVSGENPLVRFWRSKQPFATSAVWDIAFSGEDYLGHPLEDPGKIGLYLGTRFFPFALQGLLVGQGDIGQRVQQQAVGLGGLRSFPSTFGDVTGRVAQGKFGQPFAQLSPEQQAEVMDSPEVRAMPPSEGKRYAGRRETQGVFEDRRAALETAAQQVEAGQISKNDFRERLGNLNEQMGTELGSISKRYPNEQRPSEDPYEQYRQHYLDILRTKDEFGRTDFDTAEAYLASLPQSVQQYIDEKQMGGAIRLGPKAEALVRDLLEARKRLRPYWSVLDTALERRGLLDESRSLNPAEQEALQKTSRYKAAVREANRQKDRLRRRDPSIDDALVEWYGRVPIRKQV